MAAPKSKPDPNSLPEVNRHRTLLTDDDLHWFNEGAHCRLHEKLGAHRASRDDVAGISLSVCDPNAERVTVIGDFNDWDKTRHPLQPIGSSGVWAEFIAGLENGATDKYHITPRH